MLCAWSKAILFFFMMLLLGIDSQFAFIETLATCLLCCTLPSLIHQTEIQATVLADAGWGERLPRPALAGQSFLLPCLPGHMQSLLHVLISIIHVPLAPSLSSSAPLSSCLFVCLSSHPSICSIIYLSMWSQGFSSYLSICIYIYRYLSLSLSLCSHGFEN